MVSGGQRASYEEIGHAELSRTAGDQHRHGQRYVDRVAFIRHSRQLSFSLEAIRELVSCQILRSNRAVQSFNSRGPGFSRPTSGSLGFLCSRPNSNV